MKRKGGNLKGKKKHNRGRDTPPVQAGSFEVAPKYDENSSKEELDSGMGSRLGS